MTEPVYFGVVRSNGKETPRRFFEQVPAVYSHPSRTLELIYCTRLDQFPNADAMINCPLSDLMRVYRSLRDANKLPPQDRGRGDKPQC